MSDYVLETTYLLEYEVTLVTWRNLRRLHRRCSFSNNGFLWSIDILLRISLRQSLYRGFRFCSWSFISSFRCGRHWYRWYLLISILTKISYLLVLFQGTPCSFYILFLCSLHTFVLVYFNVLWQLDIFVILYFNAWFISSFLTLTNEVSSQTFNTRKCSDTTSQILLNNQTFCSSDIFL